MGQGLKSISKPTRTGAKCLTKLPLAWGWGGGGQGKIQQTIRKGARCYCRKKGCPPWCRGKVVVVVGGGGGG